MGDVRFSLDSYQIPEISDLACALISDIGNEKAANCGGPSYFNRFLGFAFGSFPAATCWRIVTASFANLTLQLQLIEGSESMGDHDSGSDDWWCVG